MLKVKVWVLLLLISLTGLILSSCKQKREKVQNYTKKKQFPNRLLLKSWHPKSIYKIPKHHIKKAKYPVIDMHAHEYALNEEDLNKRVKIMNETGVKKSVVMRGLTKIVNIGFDSLYTIYSKYPDRFMIFCGIDYSGYEKKGWSQKVVRELKRKVKKGAKGIGELSDKGNGLAPGMHPDDPRMDPIFEEAAKLGIPVNLHMADPMWMYEPMDSTNEGLMRSWTWRIKNKNQKADHKELIKILAHTLQKHPNTMFVIAHLANLTYNLSKLGDLFDIYPNFYADIGARFVELATIPRYAANFLEKYQDRIVYGTDYGWETFNSNTPSGGHNTPLQEFRTGHHTTTLQMFRMTFRVLETEDDHFYLTDLMGYKWPMYGLGLSDEALKKIYRDNALTIIQ